jgi:hypothetical protein
MMPLWRILLRCGELSSALCTFLCAVSVDFVDCGKTKSTTHHRRDYSARKRRRKKNLQQVWAGLWISCCSVGTKGWAKTTGVPHLIFFTAFFFFSLTPRCSSIFACRNSHILRCRCGRSSTDARKERVCGVLLNRGGVMPLLKKKKNMKRQLSKANNEPLMVQRDIYPRIVTSDVGSRLPLKAHRVYRVSFSACSDCLERQ